MDVREASESVRRTFAARGGEYGLDGGRVRTRYVLNRGGFENASFTITDGERSLHFKLAGGHEARDRLLRWHALRGLLEERYHAPRILDWVDLADGTGGGLLFEHIPGRAPRPREIAALAPDLLPVLEALHSDDDLAARLPSPQPTRTCADALCETYIRRFEDDLDIVEGCPPPFVPPDRLAWMREETRRLEDAVRGAPAFLAPATAPVHGDLWPGNLRVTQDGGWFILDWDDLGPGDPAMDLACLPPARAGGAAGGRLPLYARASLLDSVIDVLADWVECEAAPDHRDAVRRRNRAIHERSLAQYTRRHGGLGRL